MYILCMDKAIKQPRTGNTIQSPKVANRRSEVRERLLANSAELFVDRGITKVSVEELIEAVGISRATFYGFFANKNEVAASILIPVFDDGRALLEPLKKLPPRQAVEQLIDVYLQLWSEHRHALLLTGQLDPATFFYIREQHNNFSDSLLKLLNTIAAAGLLRNDSAEITSMVLAKTAVPLLRVYQAHEDFERIYRESILALLVRDKS
jgi:AcrR family transcriptional regulator